MFVAATIPWSMPAIGEQPCADPRYAHGISHLLPLQYHSDFTHFAYANPDAPKAGEVRVAVLGTFDNYNGIIEKGRLASGYDATGGLVYDRLLEPAIDEPVSYYGRLAEGVVVDPDFEWVAFRLRADATWHDGAPITVEDVLFTFEAMQEHGSVALRTALADPRSRVCVRRSRVVFRTQAGRGNQSHVPVHIEFLQYLAETLLVRPGHRKDHRPGASGQRAVPIGARRNRVVCWYSRELLDGRRSQI